MLIMIYVKIFAFVSLDCGKGDTTTTTDLHVLMSGLTT